MSRKLLTPSLIAIIMIILVSLILPVPARAGGTVGNGNPASCTESALYAAIGGGGYVNFNCGPNPLTISLSTDMTIYGDTTIDGGGLITLSGANVTRHFRVNIACTLTLLNLTLTNGSAAGGGGSILNDGTVNISNSNLVYNEAPYGSGGAIQNYNILHIYNSVLSNNSANGGTAGAIYNLGTLTIDGSTLTNNSASEEAGSIANHGTADITSSIFEANQASSAGAIYNAGNLSITDSTFNFNSTYNGSGGGVYNKSVLSINRSIFFGNTVSPYQGGGLLNTASSVAVINKTKFVLNDASGGVGGGIANNGQMTLLASQFAGNNAEGGIGGGVSSTGSFPLIITNSTFSGNRSSLGGGIFVDSNPTTILNTTFYDNENDGIAVSSGNVSLKNTIVAANNALNCNGTVISQGYNLEDASTCGFTGPGDLKNTNPMLGPIQDNGGPTWTHALLPGSPAINAGTNNGCPGADQRGVKRPLFGTCDIGAYEFGFFQYLPVLVK